MKQGLLTLLLATLLLPNFVAAQQKTYKIGCNENYYPYILFDEETGELQGIVIDWWKLWAEKTNSKVEFIPLTIEECIQQTNSGEIDIVAGMFFSKERSQYLDFSEPLIRMKTVLFLKKDNKPDSLQIIGDSIGVLKDDLAYSFLTEHYPEIKLKVFDKFIDLQSIVKNQEINGFVYDIPNPIRSYREPNPPKGYYVYEVLYDEALRAAVKPGNSEMLAEILTGVSKISDEELLAVAEQWAFFKKDKRILWYAIAAAMLLGISIALILSKIFRDKKKLKMLEDYMAKTDWKLIIDKGENDHIEFKSSLRYDYRLHKANKILEKVIAKTISAFLNTEGGMLFIGVDDEGKILGLDNDYGCLSKSNRDGFLLSLTNVINVQLGKSVHKFIHINIISINERDVCIVTVEESDKPIFMGKNDNEEFYIRASASSQPLGVRETYKYINSHWKK